MGFFGYGAGAGECLEFVGHWSLICTGIYMHRPGAGKPGKSIAEVL